MTIQETISKAIEGGWTRPIDAGCTPDPERILKIFGGDIFLDPFFWQSLGKAMGWEEEVEVKEILQDVVLAVISLGSTLLFSDERKYPTWKLHWHRFIDHLAEGKSAERFFVEL